MTEEWRDVVGYEGLYAVSNMGNVMCVKKLKPSPRGGYPGVVLSKNGKRESKSVHRLVAEAFIPNPERLPVVNHKDEDKGNARADNLEWCTAKYNMNYGTIRERRSVSQTARLADNPDFLAAFLDAGAENARKYRAKISRPVVQLTASGEIVAEFSTEAEAAKATGISQSSISACCRGEYAQTKGYVFKFKEDMTE